MKHFTLLLAGLLVFGAVQAQEMKVPAEKGPKAVQKDNLKDVINTEKYKQNNAVQERAVNLQEEKQADLKVESKDIDPGSADGTKVPAKMEPVMEKPDAVKSSDFEKGTMDNAKKLNSDVKVKTTDRAVKAGNTESRPD